MTDLSYIKEIDRFNTFSNWPVDYIDKHLLAKVGFYYCGKEDRVKCFVCSVEIYKWERGDDPLDDHKKHSPLCKLINGYATMNIPIDKESFEALIPQKPLDEVGNNDFQYEEYSNSLLENLRSSTLNDRENETIIEYPLRNLTLSISFNNLHELNNTYPYEEEYYKKIDYSIQDNRIKTFKNWPTSVEQKPDDLSEAGFYYSGFDDCVVCFNCFVSIRQWEKSDNAWEEHYKYSPTCSYLTLMKGDYFNTQSNKKKGLNETSNTESKDNENGVSKNENKEELSLSSLTIDTRICKICYKNQLDTLFLPCAHSIACKKCAMTIQINFGNCSVCKTTIDKIQPIYFS